MGMSVRSLRLLNFLFLFYLSVPLAAAPDIEATRRLLIGGKYESVIENAEKAIASKERDDEWRTLLIRGQLALGKYAEAYNVATNSVKRYSSSIRMKLAAYDALQANGQAAAAASLLEE